MRYEVLIMMAVVGAINVVGRIMAKRAKDRLAAEQSNAIESSAKPQPIDRSRAVVAVLPTTIPVREAIQMPVRAASRAVLRDAVAVEVIPTIAVPVSVGMPTMAAVAQAKVAKSLPGPVRPMRAGWSARRLRDGLVASEILGPPVSLRS